MRPPSETARALALSDLRASRNVLARRIHRLGPRKKNLRAEWLADLDSLDREIAALTTPAQDSTP